MERVVVVVSSTTVGSERNEMSLLSLNVRLLEASAHDSLLTQHDIHNNTAPPPSPLPLALLLAQYEGNNNAP